MIRSKFRDLNTLLNSAEYAFISHSYVSFLGKQISELSVQCIQGAKKSVLLIIRLRNAQVMV
jgi:hypothetical protein